jgi:hypothetical protein
MNAEAVEPDKNKPLLAQNDIFLFYIFDQSLERGLVIAFYTQ